MRTIQDIAQDVATQDNAITELPIFIVRQKRRTYGIDSRYTDDFVWMSDGAEPHEADSETAAKLDAAFVESCDWTVSLPDVDDPEDELTWTKVGYRDHWEFVTACFTRRGCEDYLRINGHNLTTHEVYVASGYRNDEWKTMREHLLARAEPMSECRLHAKAMVAIMDWIQDRTGTVGHDELIFSVMNTLALVFKKKTDMVKP